MKRILTAAALIALVGVLLFLGKLWMIALLAAVIAVLAAVEFEGLSRAMAAPVPRWWIVSSIALFFLAAFERPQDALSLAVVAFCTLVLFGWNAFRLPQAQVLGATASGAFLLLYIALPMSLLPWIWAREEGTPLLVFLFLCVWCGDIAALYIGKNFGRHKLVPSLSPNKTWEGSIASIAGSVVFGVGLILLGDRLDQHGSPFTCLHTAEPWWQFLLLAIVLNVAAQLGDLVESALKRGAGVKDSGTLLPGHGGMLDRIDALLLAAPVLWFVLLLRDLFATGTF